MTIPKAAYAFALRGNPLRCREFGHGNINSTFLVTTDAGHQYILQKINTYVFRQPVQLMANAGAVTDFIRRRIADPRLVLHFINTYESLPYHRDDAGGFWRMYDFIGGITLDAPKRDEDLYQCALAFGRFQHLLSGFPADTLFDTIPDFHNTPVRLEQLKASANSDCAGRLAQVRQDVQFLLDRQARGSKLQQLLEEGTLPLRVTHNDTKLDNVLLDPVTRKALCVLDLDTVMSGLSVHDFGDCVRCAAATATEDEPIAENMKLDLHRFRVCTRGFLEGAPSLTKAEMENLPLGAYTITLELAARFLADYLGGDLYFKTAYPQHNLIRARSQMALLADMEKKWDTMQELVAQTAAQLRC